MNPCILSLVALLAIPEDPMTDLKASYPYGEQRAIEVSSNNKLAFVAEGAAIAILDVSALATNGAPVVDRIEVPRCAPMALAHYQHPTSLSDWLFIAGGSNGLWRVDLCSGLFGSTPTACSSYTKRQVDVVETANFERKVCIDVAIVEGNSAAGETLLCAIYAAREDADSSVGPSEARFYKLNSNGTIVTYGSPLALTSSATQANSIAFAVASDPLDPDSVYVSLGTGWLHKIDISTSSFSLSPVAADSGIAACAATTCPEGERMRDIAVVATENYGSFLYAAVNYGRILEFELATGGSRETSIGVGFTDRIAAVTDGHDNILIAAANQGLSSVPSDSWAVFRALGVWYDPCLSYYAVDGNSGFPSSENKIRYYTRDASTSAGSPPASELVSLGDQTTEQFWGSLVLRQFNSVRYGSFESNYSGTTIRRIWSPFTTSPLSILTPIVTYKGDAMGAGEGVVSSLNPEFTYFGGEGRFPGLMFVGDPSGDIIPNDNVKELCDTTPSVACTQCSTHQPNPYFGSLMGHTAWPDADEEHEWFMSGDGRVWEQITTAASCTPPGGCNSDPCPTSTPTFCWQIAPGSGIQPSSWKLIRMATAGADETSSAATIDMRWWQVNWDETQQTVTPGTTPYLYTMADMRTDPGTGFPLLIHGLRAAAAEGYTIFDGADLGNQALSELSGTCSPNAGRGEFLTPQSISAFTQLDMDPTLGCVSGLPCSSFTSRNWFTNKCDQFTLDGGEDGTRYVVAIASGNVTAGSGSGSGCDWDAAYKAPMVVFYDVTDVPPTPPATTLNAPVLLRAALGVGNCESGPCAGCAGGCQRDGNAWCVRVKTLEVDEELRTFAFVGDVNARLLVYDVSYDQLYPATADAYADRLSPIGCVCFPVNPWDNQRDNILDLELDGSFAYCALGRGGVGIVNILDPYNPVIEDVVDTPGVVEGIAMRTASGNVRQMVVGDLNAGMHLFGRPGE